MKAFLTKYHFPLLVGTGLLLFISCFTGAMLWLAHNADSDNRACRDKGGHIVESGIDNGKACVDDEWKLVR